VIRSVRLFARDAFRRRLAVALSRSVTCFAVPASVLTRVLTRVAARAFADVRAAVAVGMVGVRHTDVGSTLEELEILFKLSLR